MSNEQDDLLGLVDYSWSRLIRRLDGLTDAEWRWRPVGAEPRISISWRLGHLRTTLADQRNWTYLALMGEPPPPGERSRDVRESIERLTQGFAALRAALARPGLDLDAEIGMIAGPYAASTRRAFLLHIIDELIHHAAEVALLRDLYSAEG